MKRLVSLLACATLAACGGGGSSSPTEDPQGFWDGDTFGFLVTPQGEMWGVEIASPNYLLYKGTLAVSGSSFTSQFTVYAGSQSVAATATGSFAPRQSLSGTATAAGQSRAFSTTYSADYDAAPNVAGLAGTYTISSGGTLSIDAAGNLSGVPNGCTTTGKITADSSGRDFYRVNVSFGPEPCTIPQGSASGILARESATVLSGGVVSGPYGDAFILTRN